MNPLHYGRPTTPGESRGILPLLVAALAAGGARSLIGGISANQQKQRNKGYINASYRRSSQILDTNQAYARQGTAESLNERGLAQGGTITANRIATAMQGDKMIAAGAPPSTIGEQVTSDQGVQMGLERQDLDQQHDRALKENKTDYMNSLIDSGVQGIQTGENVFSAGQSAGLGGAPAAAPSLSRASIHSALLSGSSYDGIHPNDPLGDPSSSWSTHPTRLATPGEANASFNVG